MCRCTARLQSLTNGQCSEHQKSLQLPTTLVVLEHGDERAADGEARAVERVAEARLERLALGVHLGGAVAQLHAARLEVAAVGARGDLAELLLAGEPHLDVVAHAREKPMSPEQSSTLR